MNTLSMKYRMLRIRTRVDGRRGRAGDGNRVCHAAKCRIASLSERVRYGGPAMLAGGWLLCQVLCGS